MNNAIKLEGAKKMSIQVNINNLNTRVTALRTAGGAFTPQRLNSIDERSTISAVRNSVTAHNKSNQIHMIVGEYLVQSADLVQDIGMRFFELDQDAASIMAL